MKLFTIGPVQMFPETLDISGKQMPYFRTEEFSGMMLGTDHLLRKLIGTGSSSKVIYLTASGTAAMEAAVINCFNKNDKILVVSGGAFGRRFSEICRIHEIPNEDIVLNFGGVLSSDILKKYDGQGFTGMLVNLHETSTGQLYDIKIISDFCRRNRIYLVVDAITAFLCDEYCMDLFGIDASIISSQKGLCLSPGLSMVVLNQRITEEKVIPNTPKSLYFNFKDYITNMERGQTPFTPAVGILLELHAMLVQIDIEGLKNRLDSIKMISSAFRKRITELPAVMPGYPLSNGLTPVIFNEPLAKMVFERLKNEYGIFINPTGGEIGNRMIRVAHIGNNTIDDHNNLIDLIKSIL